MRFDRGETRKLVLVNARTASPVNQSNCAPGSTRNRATLPKLHARAVVQPSLGTDRQRSARARHLEVRSGKRDTTGAFELQFRTDERDLERGSRCRIANEQIGETVR